MCPLAAASIKRVLAWQFEEARKAAHLGKTGLADAMHTSRSQIDRGLDPENVAVSLDMLSRAAMALGSPDMENVREPCQIPFMRQVLNDIEAGKVAEELRRRGVPSNQRVRVVVESIEDDGLPMTAINAAGGAFDWLADEPDLYSDDDLVERFRT